MSVSLILKCEFYLECCIIKYQLFQHLTRRARYLFIDLIQCFGDFLVWFDIAIDAYTKGLHYSEISCITSHTPKILLFTPLYFYCCFLTNFFFYFYTYGICLFIS